MLKSISTQTYPVIDLTENLSDAPRGDALTIPQYNVKQIAQIWAAAAVPKARLLFLTIPLILLTGVTLVMTAAYELQFSSLVNKLWVSTFPFLAEPAGFSMVSLVNTPEGKARMGRRVGVSNSVHRLCRVQPGYG